MKRPFDSERKNPDRRPLPHRKGPPPTRNLEALTTIRESKWIRGTCVLLCVACVVALLYVGKSVLLPIAFAILGAMTFALPVRKLHERRIPNPLAAAMVMVCFIVLACFAATYLGRPAVEWFSSMPDKLPELKTKFQHIVLPAAKLSKAADQVEELTTLPKDKPTATVEVKDKGMSTSFFTWTGGLVGRIVESLTLMFLILASGDGLSQKAVACMPRDRDRTQAVVVVRHVQENISSYLLAVSGINLAVGMLLALVFYALQLPNPLMWGGVVALLNFIPYFGPITGMVLVAAAGLWSKDSLLPALLPSLAYVVIHVIEANLVTPFALGKKFALDPVIIFIALLMGVAIWGGAGAFLAMPALVTLKAISDSTPGMGYISELLGPRTKALSPDPTQPSSEPAVRASIAPKMGYS